MKVKSVTPINDGMDRYAAEQFWSSVEGFAAYSFNKSHSAEYSLISWVTMWLKVYYPAEFYAAAMTVIDKEEKLAGLVTDARSKGLEVLPPDIGISSNRIEIEGNDKLYAPFQAIKGISSNVAAAIMKLRDYENASLSIAKGGFTLKADNESIMEFDPSVQKAALGSTRVAINKAHIEKLSRVGALWRYNKQGHPATHPDRLKDRIELMPGFTVDAVRATRGINATTVAQLQVTRLVEDMRASGATSFGDKVPPAPFLGKSPRFMLVFDAPNWKEQERGKMLMGSSADVIIAAMQGVGLHYNDGYFTALTKVSKDKGAKALSNQSILDGGEWLKKELEILKPPVIVAMGSNAVRWFSPGIKGSPADLAGKVIFRADLDASVIFGLNPDSLYFDPSKLTLVESVFDQLHSLIT